jgi:hypothetical protein
LVAVPATEVITPASRKGGDTGADNSRITEALEGHVRTLRDQLERAQTMLDDMKAKATAAGAKRREAHATVAGLADIIRHLQDRLRAATAQEAAAVETLRRVHERGFWARMLGR